jgi:hypothetical protein
MTIKYLEPEVIDPRLLEAGDQVGCLNGGRHLQVMTCDPDDQIDEFWLTLLNTPDETTHIWDRPVPHGNTALDLAGFGWKVAMLPQVWARRRIR